MIIKDCKSLNLWASIFEIAMSNIPSDSRHYLASFLALRWLITFPGKTPFLSDENSLRSTLESINRKESMTAASNYYHAQWSEVMHITQSRPGITLESLWNYDLTQRITWLKSDLTPPSWLDLTQNLRHLKSRLLSGFRPYLISASMGSWTQNAYIGLTYNFWSCHLILLKYFQPLPYT